MVGHETLKIVDNLDLNMILEPLSAHFRSPSSLLNSFLIYGACWGGSISSHIIVALFRGFGSFRIALWSYQLSFEKAIHSLPKSHTKYRNPGPRLDTICVNRSTIAARLVLGSQNQPSTCSWSCLCHVV